MNPFKEATITIPLKKLSNTAKDPVRGSDAAAGYDLCADIDEDITIMPHQTKKIGTGLSMAIPEGYFGALFPRSGLATKHGLRLANCVGVIDADYRGEIMVPLHNDNWWRKKKIRDEERIAQLILLPTYNLKFHATDNLDETERGSGGFGSTGLEAFD